MHPSSRSHPVATRSLLVVLALALFIGFLGLGSWQLQRRAWKLALIERVNERVRAAPVAAPAPAQWPGIHAAEHEYQPVTLTGRFVREKTVLVQAATELGAGFWVLTPLQAADGSHTLVNRGFIPSAQRQAWLPDQGQAGAADRISDSAEQTLTGLLRMTEPGGGFLRDNDPARQRWYSRDVQAIAQAMQLERPAPYFIDQSLPTQASRDTWPRPGMTVIHFHNSHLVYALTWYGMALLVLVAGWVVVRTDQRHNVPARKTPPAA